MGLLRKLLCDVAHRNTTHVSAGLRQLSSSCSLRHLADSVLTEQQVDIKEQARQVAETELLPYSHEWDKTSHFPVDKLRLLGDLGYGGCFIDEQFGGLQLGRADVACLFENLSYGDVPLTAYLSIHNMVGRVINTYASAETKRRYLPDVAAMQALTSYCLTEAGSGSDAAALKTTATRDGDAYVLNGSKAFISGGAALRACCDTLAFSTYVAAVLLKGFTSARGAALLGGVSELYLVMARTDPEAGPRGVSAFLVEAGAGGVSFGAPEDKMGWRCQPTCAVNLDGVRVPAANLVGGEGQGFRIAMGALDGGRVNIAACSIGGAQFAFDRTMEYISTRKQFKQRLDEFQATQFRMADLATRLTASRLLVQQAAQALDQQAPSGTMLAAMAKRFATDECSRVADECLQLHGGYGYIKEYGIEQRVRDLRVHSILEGTNEIMRHVIWNRLQHSR